MSFGYCVYFTERDRNRVIRWDPDRNTTEVLAGESQGGESDQRLNDPYSLAFGPDGVLLVADKLNHRICRLVQGRLEALATKDTDGHRQRMPESSANHSPDQPRSPSSLVAEKDGSILCSYFDDHTIYRIHPGGRLELVLGKVPNRPYFHNAPREFVPPSEARSEDLYSPTGLVARSDGTIFFVERPTRVVRSYHASRGLRSIFPLGQQQRWTRMGAAPASGKVSDYHPSWPVSLTIGPGDELYLCDSVHSCVLRVKPEQGTFDRVLHSPKPEGSPYDAGPLAVAFGPDGTLWVADSFQGAIQAYQSIRGGPWAKAPQVLSRVRQEPLALGNGSMGLIVGR